MKRLVLAIAAICLVFPCVFAQDDSGQSAAQTVSVTVTDEVTIRGDIIDNNCAGSQAVAALAEFAKTHTKECALKCADGGYGILSESNFYRFDKASSAKITEFLAQPDSRLQVAVKAKKVGDGLSLISIENQQ